MNKEHVVVVSARDQPALTQPDSIAELLRKCLYQWPYFILSLVLTLGLAFAYLKLARPVYEIKAKLLIKDEKNVTPEKAPLEKLDVYNKPKTVENELEVLKSRELLSKVVKQQSLWLSYYVPEKFQTKELFSERPFTYHIVGEEPVASKDFQIRVLNGRTFQLERKGRQPFTARFGDVIRTGAVKWTLKPTDQVEAFANQIITVHTESIDRTVARYQSAINISTINKLVPVVELTIDDHLPERGKIVLNTLVNTYKQSSLDEKNKITLSTLNFIDQRLASLSDELAKVERNVEGFKSSHSLTDISAKAKVFLENVQTNDNRLNDVNVQLEIVHGIERYVRSKNASANPPATLGISDPGLISLVNQLSNLHLQKTRLLATTPEENPIFDPLNRQIQATKAAIADNLQTLRVSLEGARSQLTNTNQKFEKSIRNIPGQERQYTDIKRQQEIKENLYVYLLQKKEEIGLSYASTLSDAKVIDTAYYDLPKSPKKPLALAIALIFGLAMPVSVILAVGLLKGKVTNRNEIESVLTAPVISEISYQPGIGKTGMGEKRNPLLLEQFRALRTRISILRNYQTEGFITLFTSSIAGEGKTFTVCNLAFSMAASGKKTILIDLDLRRPKISDLMEMDSDAPGAIDFILGEANLEDIIRSIPGHPYLSVITAGRTKGGSAELLEAPRLGQLLEELRMRFSNVLIDSPPVHLVSDAMLLSHFTDATMYLIRQGYTSKKELHFIEELQNSKHLKNLHIVFNAINLKKHGYGYKYDSSYYH